MHALQTAATGMAAQDFTSRSSPNKIAKHGAHRLQAPTRDVSIFLKSTCADRQLPPPPTVPTRHPSAPRVHCGCAHRGTAIASYKRPSAQPTAA